MYKGWDILWFFPIREARRLSFCVLVHRGVRGSRPYFGFLYSLISTNYHIGIDPKVSYLGLIGLEIRFFLSLACVRESTSASKDILSGSRFEPSNNFQYKYSMATVCATKPTLASRIRMDIHIRFVEKSKKWLFFLLEFFIFFFLSLLDA